VSTIEELLIRNSSGSGLQSLTLISYMQKDANTLRKKEEPLETMISEVHPSAFEEKKLVSTDRTKASENRLEQEFQFK
jgi:hypothetical protein